MSYCIMRMAKQKSARDVVMMLQHNTRERQPKNADAEKTKNNWTFGGGSLEVVNRYHQRLPEKVRANAVHAVELVMTASPEFSGAWDDYLNDCDKWALELFGGKANLLHIAHHYDESTPHTHISFMPLKDSKLNAKHFIGGSRDRMAELQNDFYEKVGKVYGLDRGLSRAETRARHTPHTLAPKASELKKKEERISGILKHTPDEVAQAISVFEELKTKTPYDLKNLADKIQKENCTTWGEYREKKARKTQREKQQGRSR